MADGVSHDPPASNSTRTFAAACCASMLALFLVEFWPYLPFRYDIDPGDGDVLNGAARIVSGLPLYGDWTRMEVSALYTPLYYYYLLLARLVGIDPAVFARASNLVFLVASGVFAAAIVRSVTRGSRYSWLFVTVAVLVLFRRTAPMQYNGHRAPFLFIIIRPDTLCLVLEMLACYLVVRDPTRAVRIGVVAALCPFVKQQAVVVPAGFFLYYLLADRRLLRTYVVTLLVVGAGLTIPLEILNRGAFIDSTLIQPGRAIGTESNWPYVWHLLGIYYMTWRSAALAALALAGVYAALRRRMPVLPLIIVFAIDAVLFLKLGQNDGAGSSYLWLHWMLLAVFAGIGAAHLLDAPASAAAVRLRTWMPGPALTMGAAVAGIAVVVLSVPVRAIVADTRGSVAHFARLQEIGARHEAHLAAVSRTRTGRLGRWYTDRQATALVRIGQVLDQDAATLKSVVASGIADRKMVLARFASGEYHFVQRTRMTDIPLLESIFDVCYRVHSVSEVPDRGDTRKAEILEYVGGYMACRYDSP